MHAHNHSFPYSRAEYEDVACDLCGSRDYETAGYARDNQRARAVICRRCGLIFISPRMTRAWYDRFYQEEYRGHGGGTVDFDFMFEQGVKHGGALVEELRPHLLERGLLVDARVLSFS